MTINLFARPLAQPWEAEPEWTSITFDGDDESTIANIVTAQLLQTRHEVQVEEEADPLEPMEDDDA